MTRRTGRGLLALLTLVTSAGCGGGDPPVPYTSPLLTARLATMAAGDFVVDAAMLGTTLRVEVVPAQPHDAEQLPVLNGAPAHLVAVFGDDPLPTVARYRDRQVRVYPLPEYRTHYIGGARAGFDRRFDALRRIIQAGRLEVDGEIPVFPQVDADQRFRARVRWIAFDGGLGVAFVTQYSKDASPPGPDDLAWVFQGLTDDNAWLVAILHPISARGVPASEDARRVAAALDTLPVSAFEPDPRLLESLAAGIRFTVIPAP